MDAQTGQQSKIGKAGITKSICEQGYSPPTTAEVLPSNNFIYQNLKPESGWNYEAGLRFNNKRLKIDVAAFHYQLEDAIVRQVDSSGAEFLSIREELIKTELNVRLIIN